MCIHDIYIYIYIQLEYTHIYAYIYVQHIYVNILICICIICNVYMHRNIFMYIYNMYTMYTCIYPKKKKIYIYIYMLNKSATALCAFDMTELRTFLSDFCSPTFCL